MTLHGSWRIASPTEPSARQLGEHCYYISPHGELIVSMRGPQGPTRQLLTWQERSGNLIVDQPSAPREQPMRFLRASEVTLQLDDSWYLRETGDRLDPDAPMWALIAGGSWYGIENAHADEPFIPFLMIENGEQRLLRRIVSGSAKDAEIDGPRMLQAEPYERAVWVRDGRVTLDGVKIDAVLTDFYAPGGVNTLSLALPYRFVAGRARIAGAFQITSG